MTIKRILIVDDLAIHREGIALLVNQLGFEADKARDATEAHKLIGTNDYAVILMDCHLPYFDGFKCTEQIRLMEQTTGTCTPVIGWSASSDRMIRAKCLEAGMDEFLEKGCSSEELEEILLKFANAADKPSQ